MNKRLKYAVTLWMGSILAACGGSAERVVEELSNAAYLATVELFAAAKLPALPLLQGDQETEQAHLGALADGGINIPPYFGYGNTGAGIGVAMLDTSIQVQHPDLQERVVAAHDFIDYDDDPSPPVGSKTAWHGTATSGLVAASVNAFGVRGVAPLASLLAYRVIGEDSTQDSGPLEDALVASVLAGAQIVNNSWTHQNNGVFTDADAGWLGVMNARVGLTFGPTLVFAAGNGGDGTMSNYDRYTNDYRVITVGSVAANGGAERYTEPGANVLLLAPGSGLVTTDLVGMDGVSQTDYTSWNSQFTGTSASAPIVSGVVALMLQANGALNSRDIAWILAKTAEPVTCPSCVEWLSPRSSAIGFPNYSHKFGFGRVNASAAVDMARSFTPITQVSQCDSGWKYPGQLPQFGLDLPDNSAVGVSASYDLSQCNLVVDRVELHLKVSPQSKGDVSKYSGDLHVALTSPGGLVSELAKPHVCPGACGDIREGFTFSSVRHMGEGASGLWTLVVSDESRNYLSRFEQWRIVIHGHKG